MYFMLLSNARVSCPKYVLCVPVIVGLHFMNALVFISIIHGTDDVVAIVPVAVILF